MKTTPLRLVLAVVVTACDDKPESVPPPPDVSVARVREVSGDATQQGRALVVDMEIRTDIPVRVQSGRAVLEIPGKGIVRIYPDSSLAVVSRSRVRLVAGKIWASIQSGGSEWEVETENAVAGVRGTELVVQVTPGRTEVGVVTGQVVVINRRMPTRSTVVGAGQKTVVASDGAPAEPVPYAVEVDQQGWKAVGGTDVTPAPAPDVVAPTAPDPVSPPARNEEMRRQEQEGERQKSEVEKEGERTRQELRREEAATRKALEEGEAATKKRLAEEAKRIKEGKDEGNDKDEVKGFLE
jgi:hypothetical protein